MCIRDSALKIGADGQVWALGFRDDGSRTLLAWRPGQRGAVSHALSPRLPDRQIDDWTPVSYTHLDVYKRQTGTFMRGSGKEWNRESGPERPPTNKNDM